MPYLTSDEQFLNRVVGVSLKTGDTVVCIKADAYEDQDNMQCLTVGKKYKVLELKKHDGIVMVTVESDNGTNTFGYFANRFRRVDE